MGDSAGGSFLAGEIPPEYLYDNPDGKRAIAPSIERIRKNVPWLAEQDSWIVWHWNEDAQKIPHRGADPRQQTEWQEAGNQSALEEAWEAYQEHDHIDGIGFVFNGTEPEILEDFDDCINPWAFSITDPCLEDALENDDEPTFFSSSGTGAHRYPVAANAEDTNQHPHEVYIGDDGNHRWAAITGFKIAGDTHGPDRSEKVNELSENYNEAGAKAVDLREFEFDADPAEIDTDAPVPEAIVEAFDGDVPRCVAGLIHVLGTHDPTDDDGAGWGQQTFMRYSYLLMLLADLLEIEDAEKLAELVASFKSPAITATQRGKHPKKGAKPKPHGEGVPWDLDYQAGKITAKVRDGDLYPPKIETIENRGNMKIGPCTCPVHGGATSASKATATDGGGTRSDSGGDSNDRDDPWQEVKDLFDSRESGSSTVACSKAAEILSKKHDFVVVRESEGMYYWNPDVGYYVRKGMTFLDELLERELPDYMNPSRLGTIRQKVKARNYESVEEFTPPRRKVNVKNGVLDLDRWADDPYNALEPPSPQYYFTAKLDVKYDPGADDGGFFERALSVAVPRECERKKILEYVGYALEMWTTEKEKAMLFVGGPGSGKSSIQEAIQSLFGSMPTVTALAPHQLADSRFDVAVLHDAALNTMNDINGGKIEDTGTLKRIISGETTKMENKNEDRFFGEPKAKHLWTGNWLPYLVGQDDSVYRRFLIVEFENQIPDSEQDDDHKRRLKEDPEVRSVLLNLALEGRARMREQGGFTNDRSRTETRRLWDSWRDSHKRFLYTHFELTGDSSDSVEKKSYWQAYGEFAARKGYEQKANRSVTKALEHVPEVGGTSGDSDHYTGLKWKDKPGGGGQQAGLSMPQNKRIPTIKGYVNSQGLADRDDILEYAEQRGIDRADAEQAIEKLLRRGELQEPQSGKLETT